MAAWKFTFKRVTIPEPNEHSNFPENIHESTKYLFFAFFLSFTFRFWIVHSFRLSRRFFLGLHIIRSFERFTMVFAAYFKFLILFKSSRVVGKGRKRTTTFKFRILIALPTLMSKWDANEYRMEIYQVMNVSVQRKN